MTIEQLGKREGERKRREEFLVEFIDHEKTL